MKWTGDGALCIKVKGDRKMILPGDSIPDGALKKERIAFFKKKGKIDGKLAEGAEGTVLPKKKAAKKAAKKEAGAGPAGDE